MLLPSRLQTGLALSQLAWLCMVLFSQWHGAVLCQSPVAVMSEANLSSRKSCPEVNQTTVLIWCECHLHYTDIGAANLLIAGGVELQATSSFSSSWNHCVHLFVGFLSGLLTDTSAAGFHVVVVLCFSPLVEVIPLIVINWNTQPPKNIDPFTFKLRGLSC